MTNSIEQIQHPEKHGEKVPVTLHLTKEEIRELHDVIRDRMTVDERNFDALDGSLHDNTIRMSRVNAEEKEYQITAELKGLRKVEHALAEYLQ